MCQSQKQFLRCATFFIEKISIPSKGTSFNFYDVFGVEKMLDEP